MEIKQIFVVSMLVILGLAFLFIVIHTNFKYGKKQEFHRSNKIHPTAIIYPNVKLGFNNVIGAYSVIGSNGEMRGVDQDDFRGQIIIGDDNVISEHVTIQRPFEAGKYTMIGDRNIIMAHSHVGHDVEIGDDCEICTGAILGGYAKICHGVKIKLGVTIRNRKKIGELSLVGLGSAVVTDVEAGTVVYGNPAKNHRK